MSEAVLGLGANLGARRATMRAALALLAARPGCQLLARSRLYETPPLGPPQPDYLNAAVRVRWAEGVDALLAATQRVEALLGRERRVRWGPRTLDIDLLYWSEGPVRREDLEVPHRELEQRAFALAPLLEVAPELAPRWASALTALGGAPALADPGWPCLQREGPYLCSDWTRDVSELASQLGDLLAARLAASGRGGPVQARSARPFGGSSTLLDVAGTSWLAVQIDQAWACGFAVRNVVVSALQNAQLSGLLLGEEGAEPRARAPPELWLERREGGQQRAKIHAHMPDDGFDFAGSATM